MLLPVVLVVGYYKLRSRRYKLAIACVLMILAGYSSYGVIIIRANANPPMCENAPDNFSKLSSYLNREQYGYTPLLYGPAYSSELDYETTRRNNKYVYKDNMIFPRMHSQRHAKAYEDWMGGVKKKVTMFADAKP